MRFLFILVFFYTLSFSRNLVLIDTQTVNDTGSWNQTTIQALNFWSDSGQTTTHITRSSSPSSCTPPNADNAFICTFPTIYETYQIVTSCPDGQSPDTNGICKPPQSCPWATTPPWIRLPLVPLSQCNNAYPENGVHSEYSYIFNKRWCSVEEKCYGLEYFCPKGTKWNSLVDQCTQPKPPYIPGCNCGTYAQPGSIDGPAGKQCFIDYICKCDPTSRTRVDVSCGYGPLQPDPQDPNHPLDEPQKDKAPSTYDDHSAKCGTEKLLAQSSCQAPNILSFSCDPKTGTVLKSTCTPPNNPNPDGSAPGDDTKGATTKDIKDLGDNLPKKIKDAFRDYFMDGSENLLSSIGEYTKTQTILQADSNDKLDAISASSDASLALQSDSNDHLSGIKSSVDAMKGSLEGGNGIPTSSMISDQDILPDSTIGSTIENLSSDLSSIQTQFANAKNIVSGNFTPPTFSGGSCPTLVGPAGITVNPAQIGARLSPYAPIISILVYISIMFITFGSVFKFLSRGLK